MKEKVSVLGFQMFSETHPIGPVKDMNTITSTMPGN